MWVLPPSSVSVVYGLNLLALRFYRLATTSQSIRLCTSTSATDVSLIHQRAPRLPKRPLDASPRYPKDRPGVLQRRRSQVACLVAVCHISIHYGPKGRHVLSREEGEQGSLESLA